MNLVDTPRGPARVQLVVPRRPAALVVLGHGAGGDTTAPAVVAVADALAAAGVAVARVDQPYRVAGRRTPAPAPQLDEAMLAVVAVLRTERALAGRPLVLGGKSSGARVACRVAGATGAVGVVALGFPLHPPGAPERSRVGELLGAGCPALVCQGSRDAFGTPYDVIAAIDRAPAVTVHPVEGGDHSFVARRSAGRTTAECLAEVADVVVAWVLAQTGQARLGPGHTGAT